MKESGDIAFDEKQAKQYDKWFETDEGKYTDKREKDLLIKLLKPEAGQTLLDVGCGTGNYFMFFEDLGYKVSGFDPSMPMMKYIEGKMKKKPPLFLALSEELPFKDNSFDVVALITSFEFVKDGKKGLEEAFRVARKKVVLGVLNKISYLNIKRRLLAPIKKSVFLKIRFYSIFELNRLIREVSKGEIKWGSVLTLPLSWHKVLGSLDGALSFWKNPFGAFLGIVVEIPEKRGD
ncbi:MAG TPA: class I SAM-dependent methyltransferase [Nitrospinota bacterium]|nr:class I SAM-dependent methyltransferase [Nitrospinota bacterium]